MKNSERIKRAIKLVSDTADQADLERLVRNISARSGHDENEDRCVVRDVIKDLVSQYQGLGFVEKLKPRVIPVAVGILFEGFPELVEFFPIWVLENSHAHWNSCSSIVAHGNRELGMLVGLLTIANNCFSSEIMDGVDVYSKGRFERSMRTYMFESLMRRHYSRTKVDEKKLLSDLSDYMALYVHQALERGQAEIDWVMLETVLRHLCGPHPPGKTALDGDSLEGIICNEIFFKMYNRMPLLRRMQALRFLYP